MKKIILNNKSALEKGMGLPKGKQSFYFYIFNGNRKLTTEEKNVQLKLNDCINSFFIASDEISQLLGINYGKKYGNIINNYKKRSDLIRTRALAKMKKLMDKAKVPFPFSENSIQKFNGYLLHIMFPAGDYGKIYNNEDPYVEIMRGRDLSQEITKIQLDSAVRQYAYLNSLYRSLSQLFALQLDKGLLN